VQQTYWPACTVRGIEPVCVVERAAILGLQRVQCRSRVVIRLDALQVMPDEITTADVPGLQLTANLVNGGLLQMERWLRTSCRGNKNESTDHSGHVPKRIDHDDTFRVLRYSTASTPASSWIVSG